jgi:hypothetical protein
MKIRNKTWRGQENLQFFLTRSSFLDADPTSSRNDTMLQYHNPRTMED